MRRSGDSNAEPNSNRGDTAAILQRLIALIRRRSDAKDNDLSTVGGVFGTLGQFDFEPMFRELNVKANGTADADEFQRWLASPSVRLTPRADKDTAAIFHFFCTGGRDHITHDTRSRELWYHTPSILCRGFAW